MAIIIEKNVIHVWKFEWQSLGDDILHDMKGYLSADEQVKANKYKVLDDYVRFCVGRAMLRYLSAEYLKVDRRSLQLDTNIHGKPFWIGTNSKLNFNISHSGDWVLLAFALENEVGIDVQQINNKTDYMNIAKYSFTTDELEALNSAPNSKRKKIFFNIWACKEAIVKVYGVGLFTSLKELSSLPLPTNIQWLIKDNLSIKLINIDTSHKAAIAVMGNMLEWEIKELYFHNINYKI